MNRPSFHFSKCHFQNLSPTRSDAEAESDDEAYEQHDNNNNKLSAQLDLPAAVDLDIVDDKIEREKTEDIMFLEPDDVEAIELALQETDQSATVDPFGTAPPSLKRRAVPNRRFESESVSPSKRVDKRKGARSIKSPRVKKEMKPRMKLEVKSEQDRTGLVEYHRDSDGEVEMEVAVRKKKSSNFKNGFRINVPKAAGARFWPPWSYLLAFYNISFNVFYFFFTLNYCFFKSYI